MVGQYEQQRAKAQELQRAVRRGKATGEAQRWQRPEWQHATATQEERAPPHRPAQAAGTRTLCPVETGLSKAG